MIRIPYKLLSRTATPPTRATAGSAALDLYADLPRGFVDVCNFGSIYHQEFTQIPTGIGLAIPEGFCGLIVGRSGLACRGLAILGGCIDSDYRGEIGVIVDFRDTGRMRFSHGDRIAQLLILPVPAVELVPADELPATGRGAAGFGSTGR